MTNKQLVNQWVDELIKCYREGCKPYKELGPKEADERNVIWCSITDYRHKILNDLDVAEAAEIIRLGYKKS